MKLAKEGDFVLLYLNERKKWLVQVRQEKEFHTDKGIVNLGEIVGRPFGTSVRSTLGYDIHVLLPAVRDHITNMQRPTQILYDKDIAIVLFRLDIRSGSIVVEAGTGSGAMTASLANAVRPDGHVYSYEIRRGFADIAKRNVTKMGLEKFVTIKNADAKLGFEENDVDAAVVDLEDPWEVVDSVHEALKASHSVASFSPTVNQLERTVEAMEGKFVDIDSVECLVRNMRVEKGKTRPRTLMIGHTGYLTFARKIAKSSLQIDSNSG